jgi:hypothetical protein
LESSSPHPPQNKILVLIPVPDILGIENPILVSIPVPEPILKITPNSSFSTNSENQAPFQFGFHSPEPKPAILTVKPGTHPALINTQALGPVNYTPTRPKLDTTYKCALIFVWYSH